jgi:hypothetical protein
LKSLRCMCGSHDHAERDRVTIDTEKWSNNSTDRNTGVRTPIAGTEYEVYLQVVIKECSRDGCSDQVAYRCRRKSGTVEEDGIESLHPDRARELIFVDKV